MFPGNRPASVTVDPEVDYASKTQKTPFPGSRANATADPQRDGDTSARKTTALPFGLPFGTTVTHLAGDTQATAQTDNSTLGHEFGEAGVTGDGASHQGAIDPEHVVDATVPGEPTGVTAVAGVTQATVSWTHPVNDGGTPIQGYSVIPHIAGVPGVAHTAAAAATSLVVTGLVTGTAYTFTVTAANEFGTSVDSTASSAVTPT